MNWLSAWTAFVKTVDCGSMAAAARALDCSRAQISKQLAELERSLQTRLLERSTRKLRLTPGGEVFYPHALRVLADLAEAEQALQNMRALPQGTLRISAPVTLGRLYIAPLLPCLAAAYPDLHCELVLNDRVIDLIDRGFDLALRLTDAPPEDLVARQLTHTRRSICASPAYLAQHGIPLTPQDLQQHRCFAYSRARSQSNWRLKGPHGEETIAVHGNFQINHVEAIRDAVLAGHGIAILPTYLSASDIARGALVNILPDYEALTSFGNHLYACYPPSRVQLPKLKVFLEALEQHFSPLPPWERVSPQPI